MLFTGRPIIDLENSGHGGPAMLVLTRRLNQSIKIGDNVEVTVIEVRGDQVRLGVSAPRDVAVHRMEVYMQIQCDLKSTESEPDSDAATAGAAMAAPLIRS